MLVHWPSARQPPRSLRVNEHLSSRCENGLGCRGDLLQSPPPAPSVNGDLLRNDEVQAEQRDVGQLAFEDDGEVGRVFEQREGLQKRLMLGGDQDCAGRNVLKPAIFELEPADCFQKPDRDLAPQACEGKNGSSAEQHRRQTDDHQNHQVQIEERIEEQRSRREHFVARAKEDLACVYCRFCKCRMTISRERRPVSSVTAAQTTTRAR